MSGWIDGHCHLDLMAPAALPGVLARAHAAGIDRLVLGGVEPAGWARQRALVAHHPGLFRSAGWHPWAVVDRRPAPDAEARVLGEALAELAAALTHDPRPIAVGELGLDHLRCPPAARLWEEAAFRAQLALARERDLPVVLHLVQSHGRALQLLRADGLPRRGGVVHGFSGSAETALDYVRLGLHVGLGFVIHRVRALKVKAAAAAVPLHRLILESDAPAEPPPRPPGAAAGPSEPADLVGIAAAIAEIRGGQPAELLDHSRQNAATLYGLP